MSFKDKFTDKNLDAPAIQRSDALREKFPNVEDEQVRVLLWQIDKGIFALSELDLHGLNAVMPYTEPLAGLDQSFSVLVGIVKAELSGAVLSSGEGQKQLDFKQHAIDDLVDQTINHQKRCVELGVEDYTSYAFAAFLQEKAKEAERYIECNKHIDGFDEQVYQYIMIETTRLYKDALITKASEQGYNKLVHNVERAFEPESVVINDVPEHAL